jgi:hypothetical protein
MLPPTVRRFFTSAPGLGLTTLIVFGLLWAFNGLIRERAPLLPSGRLNSPSGQAERPAPSPLPSLPEVYADEFPSLALPSSLTTPENHVLGERLGAFLSRPIESHEEATERMHRQCPAEVSDRLVNPDQYNGDSDFWMNGVTKEEIVARRASVVRWLDERLAQGQKVLGSDQTGRGQGIVLTGGNQASHPFNQLVLAGSGCC